jgi:hypothetical protein
MVLALSAPNSINTSFRFAVDHPSYFEPRKDYCLLFKYWDFKIAFPEVSMIFDRMA